MSESLVVACSCHSSVFLLFPLGNACGFLTFVPHLTESSKTKKNHLMFFSRIYLFFPWLTLCCVLAIHLPPSMTPAFLTHLDNFPMISLNLQCNHFPFTLPFLSLSTLSGLCSLILPSLCSWCLMPHICLFLTFDYFSFTCSSTL